MFHNQPIVALKIVKYFGYEEVFFCSTLYCASVGTLSVCSTEAAAVGSRVSWRLAKGSSCQLQTVWLSWLPVTQQQQCAASAC